jgi:hypothetical protein
VDVKQARQDMRDREEFLAGESLMMGSTRLFSQEDDKNESIYTSGIGGQEGASETAGTEPAVRERYYVLGSPKQ